MYFHHCNHYNHLFGVSAFYKETRAFDLRWEKFPSSPRSLGSIVCLWRPIVKYLDNINST